MAEATRSLSTRRWRLVTILLIFIFVACSLLMELLPMRWDHQLALTSLISPWNDIRNYSNTAATGFREVSAVTTPSQLVTHHSSQQSRSTSSSSYTLIKAGVTSERPISGNRNSSWTKKPMVAATSRALPPLSTAAPTTKAPGPMVCPSAPLLTVNGGGRLGNKLCQYFTLWAEHRTNFTDTNVWISSKMGREFSRQFAGRRSIAELPERCRPKHLHPVRMDAVRSGLRQGRDVCIGGGVCDVAGFVRFRDTMLAEFPWKEDLASAAAARLAMAGRRFRCNATECTFIGVHMRRTDYSEWIKNRMRGSPVGTEYFQCALSLCRRRYPGAVFVVASDDVVWARANILGGDVMMAADLVPDGKLRDRDAALDMATLSLCNHTIVSYGTFSYMSAFMAGGDIVAPTGYSNNEHFVADGMVRSGWPVTLLHYRTCREVPLDHRTPYSGLSLVISCDM